MVADGEEFTPELADRAFEDSDDEKMTRSGPASTPSSQDPATAEALKPWYRQLCKRPCFHDEYLQAYNEPNATSSTPTARASSASTRPASGSAASTTTLDCLIFASGFEVGTELRPPLRLRDDRARRPSRSRTAGRTACGRMHGIHVHGFPNLFIVGFARAPT